MTTYRFKHDCMKCPLLKDYSEASDEKCHACAIRDTYTPENVECCTFCKYPKAAAEPCPSCSRGFFDGRASYLASIDVCGIGNTDADQTHQDYWNYRTWRELGGAVAGAKKNQPYFKVPLARLLYHRLRDTRALARVEVATIVPSTKELLPFVFNAIASVKDELYGAHVSFNPSLLVKGTDDQLGGQSGGAASRWTAFQRAGLYTASQPWVFAGKRVLLFDDVYKTGASAQLCAKNLLAAGAKEVHAIALVRWPFPGTTPILRAGRLPF